MIALCVVSCSTRPYKIKRAETLYQQGQIHLSEGDREKAMAKFQESLRLSTLAGFKAGIAHNQNEIAIMYTADGEFDKARNLLKQSLDMYQTLDMKPEVSKTLNNIAITYLQERRFEEAIGLYQKLAAWDETYGNDLGMGLTFYNMGMVYQKHMKQLGNAKYCYTKALVAFKKIGHKGYTELLEKMLSANSPEKNP